MPSHLFVYGTLRRSCDNAFARRLAELGQFVGAARIAGQLYDFGDYPGARPTNNRDTWVRGEVYQLNEASHLWAWLDEYEGPEFERTVASVQTDEGWTIECWVFWHTGKSTGRLIESGDWFA